METLPSFPEPRYFFKRLEIANTGYGNSDYFRNPNLQYFEILLDNNIIFANCYVIFKNYDDNISKNSVKRSSLTEQ